MTGSCLQHDLAIDIYQEGQNHQLNFVFFQGIKIRKQRSTGDLDRKGVIGSHSFRSTGSTSSWMSSESNYAGGHPGSVMSEGSQASFVVEVSRG